MYLSLNGFHRRSGRCGEKRNLLVLPAIQTVTSLNRLRYPGSHSFSFERFIIAFLMYSVGVEIRLSQNLHCKPVMKFVWIFLQMTLLGPIFCKLCCCILIPNGNKLEGLSHEWEKKVSYLLTYGAEPFLRSRKLCSPSRTPQHFMEPEGSIPCSQEPSTSPYPEPYPSTPSHPISLRSILMLSTHLRWSLDSSVGIATGYGLDDRGVEVRVPQESRIFSFPSRPDWL
jgi:hypothetical protein